MKAALILAVLLPLLAPAYTANSGPVIVNSPIPASQLQRNTNYMGAPTYAQQSGLYGMDPYMYGQPSNSLYSPAPMYPQQQPLYTPAPTYYPQQQQQMYPWMMPQQPMYAPPPQQQQAAAANTQQPAYSPSRDNTLQVQSNEIEKELAVLSENHIAHVQAAPAQPPIISSPSGGFYVPEIGKVTAASSTGRNRPVAVIPKHTSGTHKNETPTTHEATKGASEAVGHTHFGYSHGHGWICFFYGFISHPDGWNYNCPETWPKDFPQCAGKAQSPIDIRSNNLEPRRLPPLIREHLWAQPESMVVENNGHTLELDGDWAKGKFPILKGGPLIDTYQFRQAHFHWGRNDNEGSEHTVNGKRMPMEMHMVHWNTKYASFEKAASQPDGLAVLGAFFEVHRTNNSMFEVLFPYLNSVGGKESRGVHMRDPTPVGILPVDLHNYVTYQGSLTTPPCSETVTWIVSITPLTLSEKQMAFMRSIVKDDHGDIHNFRPPQPLNGRKVYLNTE